MPKNHLLPTLGTNRSLSSRVSCKKKLDSPPNSSHVPKSLTGTVSLGILISCTATAIINSSVSSSSSSLALQTMSSFRSELDGSMCFVKIDPKSNSILWEYHRINPEIRVYDKIYRVEIVRDNVKEIYVHKSAPSISECCILLKYAPKIYEIITESRVCLSSPSVNMCSIEENQSDEFLKSVKNWTFCRVLHLSSLSKSGRIDFSKFFNKPTRNAQSIQRFYCNEVLYNVSFGCNDFKRIPFNIQFLMNCVNTKHSGLLNDKIRFQQIKQTIERLCSRKSHKRIEDTLRALMEENNINYNQFCKVLTDNVEEIKFVPNVSVGSDVFLIKRVVITPLCVEYYEGVETGNRVLRQYAKKIDNFLRVSFCDDSLQMLSLASLPESFEMKFMEAVISGIDICGKRFEMLAYSNSQLRSCSAWFVTEMNPQEIINSLGNFEKIKEPGKYGSRIGLCFSTTTSGLPVKYLIGKDIHNTDMKFIFNDGIGLMNPGFAESLATHANIKKNGCLYIPSAFQFRMSTFKGLVQLTQLDESLRILGVDIIFSPNQCKVPEEWGEITESGYYNGQFEIIGYSERKGPCSNLNKQIISLLLSNNLPSQKLEQILDEEACASNFTLTHISNKMFNHKISRNINQYSHLVTDRFTFELNKCGMKKSFKDLLEFRIPVSASCSLMGVLDFSNVLEENEIFIQLSPLEIGGNSGSHREKCMANGGIVTGPVMVTKNPCLHPGDIRKLVAINDHRTEKLKHLKDVIVFSSKGERPQASKMSGSDLDGDIFFASWDERLLEFEEFEPMTEESNSPRSIEDCNYKSIRHFFYEFSKHDILGRIASKHLEVADLSEQGARSPECLKLAELHSQQVNSVKSGNYVTQPLRKTMTRPQYMKPSPFIEQYSSKSAMGQLHLKIEFRIKDLKRLFEKTQISNQQIETILSGLGIDLLNLVELPIYFKLEELFHEYQTKLKRLMRQYHVESEAKMISGFINFNKKERVCGQKTYHLIDSIKDSVVAFVSEFEGKLNDLIDHKDNNLPTKTTASLCLHLVASTTATEIGQSFYWLVIDKIFSD